ncbi:hypothetical protein QTO34_019812 [Cnephaeus nilssonii]|uniref:Uncharacterized protein n=1 Tax=Cnephaeus nilssonii TaxID=3371016 RepID=A0AA40HXB5_CNENI|nr:hypothetical protein QTO34_019812 [Eptesicus nilssonii]
MGWAATGSALIPGDSRVESSSAKTVLCFCERRRRKTQQSVLLPKADQGRPGAEDPGDLQGFAQGPAPTRPRGQLRGRRGLRTSLSEMYPNQEQGVPHGEGVPRAPAGTVVPPELLE